MEWVQRAWTEVPSQTIRNCFHHRGFEKDFEENFDIKNDFPELKNILKAAIEVGCDVSEGLDAEMVAYFDNDLIVSEKLPSSEIRNLVCGSKGFRN